MQVVIEQPIGRRFAGGGIVAGREGLGVPADQVVQPVAARGGLVDQMLIVKALQAAAGGLCGGAVEGGGSTGVDVRARVKPKPQRNSRC